MPMFDLDTKTFNAFRELVYSRSGITLSEGKLGLVSARLGKRVRALGLSGFSDYLRMVEKDEDSEELVQLLDAISTNVTHFFREPSHFEFLEGILRHWVKQGRRKFRIWCAASSTGEEPYTIAMVMHQSLREYPDADWKILATDISTRVLKFADAGLYPSNRIQNIPSGLISTYFEKKGYGEDAEYQVKPDLRKHLIFRRLNLSKPPFPVSGDIDLIMCRNVMIYFDNEVRGRLLKEFHRLLKPKGALIVGHSESLTGMLSDFKNRAPSIYQKGAA